MRQILDTAAGLERGTGRVRGGWRMFSRIFYRSQRLGGWNGRHRRIKRCAATG
ncbi:hypothetical protein BC826DRAFT_1025594, partial [Russula brevipes]